jgi:hypothetical protein
LGTTLQYSSILLIYTVLILENTGTNHIYCHCILYKSTGISIPQRQSRVGIVYIFNIYNMYMHIFIASGYIQLQYIPGMIPAIDSTW